MSSKSNGWNDPPDVCDACDDEVTIEQLLERAKIYECNDCDKKRTLTDNEKKAFKKALKNAGRSENSPGATLMALFFIFIWPIIWVLIAHFVWHF